MSYARPLHKCVIGIFQVRGDFKSSWINSNWKFTRGNFQLEFPPEKPLGELPIGTSPGRFQIPHPTWLTWMWLEVPLGQFQIAPGESAIVFSPRANSNLWSTVKQKLVFLAQLTCQSAELIRWVVVIRRPSSIRSKFTFLFSSLKPSARSTSNLVQICLG